MEGLAFLGLSCADRAEPVGGFLDYPPGATRITRRCTWIPFGFFPVRTKKGCNDWIFTAKAVQQFPPDTDQTRIILKCLPQLLQARQLAVFFFALLAFRN